MLIAWPIRASRASPVARLPLDRASASCSLSSARFSGSLACRLGGARRLRDDCLRRASLRHRRVIAACSSLPRSAANPRRLSRPLLRRDRFGDCSRRAARRPVSRSLFGTAGGCFRAPALRPPRRPRWQARCSRRRRRLDRCRYDAAPRRRSPVVTVISSRIPGPARTGSGERAARDFGRTAAASCGFRDGSLPRPPAAPRALSCSSERVPRRRRCARVSWISGFRRLKVRRATPSAVDGHGGEALRAASRVTTVVSAARRCVGLVGRRLPEIVFATTLRRHHRGVLRRPIAASNSPPRRAIWPSRRRRLGCRAAPGRLPPRRSWQLPAQRRTGRTPVTALASPLRGALSPQPGAR